MVSLTSLLEFASLGPRRHVGTTFQALLDKLEESAREPDVQLAIIDYWLGLLFLTRSRIQSPRAKS